MFGIEFIEVGIGLVFGFLAISTISSGVVELFNKLTSMKSKHLKAALGTLLDDPNYNGFVKELYDHHLIASPLAKKLGEPDYIEAKDFGVAVFDILGGAAESALYKSMLKKVQKMPEGEAKTEILSVLNANPDDIKVMKEDVATFFTHADIQMEVCKLIASYSDGTGPYKALYARITEADGDAEKQLLKILEAKPADIAGMTTEIKGWFGNAEFDEALFDLLAFSSKEMQKYEKVEARINTIQDKAVRERLLGILESSATDLENMRAKVETWFNTTMDQVSEWYRRKMRIFVALVSVVVVVALNADTIRLAQELWYDNELREATVDAASTYVEKNAGRFEEPDVKSVENPPGKPFVAGDSTGDSTRAAITPPVAPDTSKLVTTAVQIKDFSNLLDTLKGDIEVAQQLPIGWKSEVLPWQENFPENKNLVWWWLSKILGLLITIGAVSFGSTYWYSQLKSLLNLRFSMSGKSANPAPAQPAQPAQPPQNGTPGAT